MAKHLGGFIFNYFAAQGFDKEFTHAILREFVEPKLIHEAEDCKWDANTRTITTPQELEEDSAAGALQVASWFKDVVAQYREIQERNQGPKRYTAKHVLFDLDSTQSVKTMHAKHDGIQNAEDLEDELADNASIGISSRQRSILWKKHGAEELNLNSAEVLTVEDDNTKYVVNSKEEDSLQEASSRGSAPNGEQIGATPTSVEVRPSQSGHDEAEATDIGTVSPSPTTASVAGHSAMRVGKTG